MVFAAICMLAAGVAPLEPSEEWPVLEGGLEIAAGSALDFSSAPWRHAPAGKYGRVVVVGDHFEFEHRPGKAFRFWGANLAGKACFPTHDEADRMAIRLARIGYNSIRLHGQDQYLFDRAKGGPDQADPALLDRFEYFAAKLIENGLYLTTDVYMGRRLKGKDIGAAGVKPNDYLKKDAFKAYTAYLPAAQENWKRNARAFLLHVNPYTGRSLAEEPALAQLATINEGNLFFTFNSVRKGPEMQSAWEAWKDGQKKQGIIWPEACLKSSIRDFTCRGIDEFNYGIDDNAAVVKFLCDWQERRDWEEIEFLRKEVGVRAPLTSSNNRPNFAAMTALKTEVLDCVDTHCYAGGGRFHVRGVLKPPYSINECHTLCTNSLRMKFAAYSRYAGRPFTVSEWNFPSPSRRRLMAGLAFGSLAARQDWNGVWRFAYSHSCEAYFRKGKPNWRLDAVRDPIHLATDRTVAFLFARGDMPVLSEVATIPMTRQKIHPPDRQTNVSMTHPTTWGYRSIWTTRIQLSPNEGPEPVIRDEFPRSGSLQIDEHTGFVGVDTPCSVGGYVERGKMTLGPLTADLGAKGGVFAVHALDGRAVRSSGRLLVQHLTDVQTEGLVVEPDSKFPGNRQVSAWGRNDGRSLVQLGSASVMLELDSCDGYSIWALGQDGRRLYEVPHTVDRSRLVFTVSTARGSIYYEITRKDGVEK